MRLTRSVVNTRLLLYLGIFVVLNLLAYQVYFRLDFTADQRYTLSPATKDMLKQLSQPITITGYFSDNLPPERDMVRRDFRDLLAEYASVSDGQIEYSLETPIPSEAEDSIKLFQMGIPVVQIPTREEDKVSVQNGYMGASLQQGERQEVIPVIGTSQGMEYALTSMVARLSLTDKPKLGFLQGHGEPGLDQLQVVQEQLRTLYQVDTFSLKNNPTTWTSYRIIVILGPTQPLLPDELAQLDQFLASGGRLLLGFNPVNASLQAPSPWGPSNSGLDTWLAPKGIQVDNALITDANLIQVSYQVRQGMFVINQPVDFPFIFFTSEVAEHPITDGLEQLIFQFAAPIRLTGADSLIQAGPLVMTSDRSGSMPAPVMFDPRMGTNFDFSQSRLNIGVWAEGRMGGEDTARVVVLSNGNFPLGNRAEEVAPDNINLFVNSIDWLAGQNGLMSLRTKGITSRPLENKPESAGARDLIKGVNVLLPLLLVIGFGLYRRERRRMQRLKWEAQDYS